YFRELAKNGKTIIITTHYLAESKNCTIVGLINKKIIETGTPLQLQQRVQKAMDLDELPDMERVFVYFTRKQKKEMKKEEK
ncbi:MAG: hypothetical protein KAR08_09315, partial [Candidatus Heimdallarchaeota archaeon]|nr:hypothetical protein [Candidatus Heimdallarchaeota archaeon]